MMRGMSGFFRLSIAIISLVILAASPAQARAPSWQISESSGRVSVETSGSSRLAQRGLALKEGDVVSTAANSRAVIVRGREYMVISPNSRISIASPKKNGSVTQILQYLGSVVFRIEKKETPHFGVKTPYLAAVVKGTTFNVTVTGTGATVQVTEGRVEVSTSDGGASDLIVPGRIARVDANDRQLLNVIGTDERSIRSPLPAVPENATTPQIENSSPAAPSSPTTPSSDAQAGSTETPAETDAANNDSEDRPEAANPDRREDNARDEGSDPIATSDFGNNDDFAGRITSAIGGEPINIAIVTGGLINGNLGPDRTDFNPRRDTSSSSSPVSNSNDASQTAPAAPGGGDDDAGPGPAAPGGGDDDAGPGPAAPGGGDDDAGPDPAAPGGGDDDG